MFKVLHNPRCARSRKGLEYLRSKTNDFELINYLSEGLTENLLKEVFLKWNQKPQDLVRTKEAYYTKYLKGKNFSEEEWMQIIKENPGLLKRPLIIGKYKVVIGDPPSNIDQILNELND